jgi:putative ABC transport system ATP-binding protein
VSAVLESRDLYRFYEVREGKVAILKGISFVLERGEFVTIMGPSGSGKSTLLHLLAGLDQPSAGSVELGGLNFSDSSEEERAAMRREKIGFIFQFFNLLPDLSVRENIILPFLIAGERPERHEERITDLLELLGIEGLQDRLPARLSGGEMQRVSIARALVVQPPILLADEPTGNLSSKAGEEIIDLLRRVREKYDSSVLLVTHNPRDAAAGDRVLFLNDGELNLENALTGGGFAASDVFHRLQELGI